MRDAPAAGVDRHREQHRRGRVDHDHRNGERFAADRQTGGITGERVPAFRPDKFVVLFPGRNGDSFKSYFQGYNFVDYLEVYEYKEGKKKPFFCMMAF